MTSWYRWLFTGVTLIVSGSGGAYFVMKYLLEANDPFAVVNHPWQPFMLHLHVLSSPWLLLLVGALLQGHVVAKIRQQGPVNRRSGLVAIGSFAVMALSGYLLQVVTSPSLSGTLVGVHVASSLVFVAAYGAHVVVSLVHARRQAAEPAPAAFSSEPRPVDQF